MKNELFDLSNKIALVTGSGQGIGFVIAQGLGKAGACVILNDINKEKLNKAVSTLSKEKKGLQFMVALLMLLIKNKSTNRFWL